ncbi:MAG: protein-L-isoaspartate(D-aspartate) O-methyltransferase [Acidimicrobiia bacterium]|nr:protein-L-isoaspartate(D-aspartate) O-methyltransferase [Acidimicrobiia bacterium]
MSSPPEITDPNVLRAMQTVPRYRFVPPHLIDEADGDYPLPIGHGQTISQPYMVAIMSQALAVGPGDKVLEIGTGSGFQAAVLAEMGCKVYSVEIIPELATRATAVLDDLSYNVEVTIGDGYHGWPEHAPYNGIVVTAAPDIPPRALLDQLDIGASLIIPLGPAGGLQTLWRYTRKPDNEYERANLGGVRFVPFTRSRAY